MPATIPGYANDCKTSNRISAEQKVLDAETDGKFKTLTQPTR